MASGAPLSGNEQEFQRERSVQPEQGRLRQQDRPPERGVQMAIVDYRTSDFSRPEVIARYAQADIVVVESSYLWSLRQNAGAVAALKSLNPDLRVLGYINAHESWLNWGEQSPDHPHNPYGYDWFHRTRPYWAWTTTGDTMMTWPGKVMLNVLYPECRAEMIDILVKYQDQTLNRLDGVFWDHFNDPLWISPRVTNVIGTVDLDQDGVGYPADASEQAAYRRSQAELVNELRAALGDRFIQIFNGGRALRDSAFAALGDGMMYENFPFVGFWGGAEVSQSLDETNPHNLFAARRWPRHANGGPWLILSNKHSLTIDPSQDDAIGSSHLSPTEYPMANFSRVVALLTDCTVSYHTDGLTTFGWPEVELALGRSLGPARRDGSVYTRIFEHGRVTLTLVPPRGWLQMSFEIVQNGRVIQAFAYPDHQP